MALSGLAGTVVAVTFFHHPHLLYSQQGGAKEEGVAGRVSLTQSVLLLWAGRDRQKEKAREREGCRQPHMAGRTKSSRSLFFSTGSGQQQGLFVPKDEQHFGGH